MKPVVFGAQKPVFEVQMKSVPYTRALGSYNGDPRRKKVSGTVNEIAVIFEEVQYCSLMC